MHCGP